MAENILEVYNLVKVYREFKAVNDISFVVPKGKVIGLLGPNGAGKTTTIQILLGISSATSGQIKYFGRDFLKYKQETLQRINYSSAYNMLQRHIQVYENLLVYAHLYGVKNPRKKIDELVEYFEIAELSKIRFYNLSAGQKTRVNLVKSLLNDPELILMDEPTASLDPDIADKTLLLIEDLKKRKNLSILFTSHDMDEVTRICDEVIFLDHGKIVAQDTPLALTKQIKEVILQITFENPQKEVEKFLKEQGYSFKFIGRNQVSIETEDYFLPKLIFKIGQAGIWIVNIEVMKPDLEDVFLTIARGFKNENSPD